MACRQPCVSAAGTSSAGGGVPLQLREQRHFRQEVVGIELFADHPS